MNTSYKAFFLGLLVVLFSATTIHAAVDSDSSQQSLNKVSVELEFTPEQLKTTADSAYLTEHYDEAISLYEQFLAKGQSADVYYNLGNAYFRKSQWAKAILAYERTLLLDPGDGDARQNLDMARANTIDKIEPLDSFFLVNVWQRICNFYTVDGWARSALVCFFLMLLGVLACFFCPSQRVKHVSFYVSGLFLVLVVLSNLCGWSLNARLNEFTGAIIMQSSVRVGNTPSEAAKTHFTLHSGTHVDILDTSIKGWANISVPDGREGWVPTTAYEVIKR